MNLSNKLKQTSTWTLFGCGYFINDIIEAIEQNDGIVTHVVLNQKLDKETEAFISQKIKLENIDNFKPSTSHYFFGFMEQSKEPLLQELKKYKITLSNIIHPFSHVARSVIMGKGNYIGPGVVIGPNTQLGHYNIINRNASLGHNVVMKDLNNIGPGAVLTGFATLGSHNFLGANSTVLPKIKVQDNITLGAGGVLTKNALLPGVYIGIPAKHKID